MSHSALFFIRIVETLSADAESRRLAHSLAGRTDRGLSDTLKDIAAGSRYRALGDNHAGRQMFFPSGMLRKVPSAAAAPILSALVTSVTHLLAMPRICFAWMWVRVVSWDRDLSPIVLNIVANAFRQ
jgi:hypothetical protein